MAKVFFRMIAGVGTVSYDGRSERTSCITELPSHFPHAGKAHLRKEVEIIFINGYLLGTVKIERILEIRGILQHGVEHGHRYSVRPQV